VTYVYQVLHFLSVLIGAVLVLSAGLQNLIQVIQLTLAGHAIRKMANNRENRWLWRRFGDSAPPITLIAPAYNELTSVVESVRSLLNLQYPQFEVVVVNDGSTDGTLAALIEAFEMMPTQRAFDYETPCEPVRGLYASLHQARLLVVDKANGGKSDALNAGINLARYDLVCAMDSDSLLEPEALLRAVQPFIEDPDRVIAVGGSIRVVNGCSVEQGRVLDVKLPGRLVALLQVGEYCRAYMLGRLAWGQLEALTLISGAFGLFRRDAAISVGGYTHKTVGEDLELVIKLHRRFRERGEPYRVVFAPDPVCWTQVPESFRDLGRQRMRWQRGAMETITKHRDMLFRHRYGRIGSLAMGNMLITDVIGPIAEVLGYAILPTFGVLGILSWSYFSAFLALSLGFNMAISVAGLALDETQQHRAGSARDVLLLLCIATVENFGYRQLCSYWRLRGTLQFLGGVQGWGSMTRQGFSRPVKA